MGLEKLGFVFAVPTISSFIGELNLEVPLGFLDGAYQLEILDRREGVQRFRTTLRVFLAVVILDPVGKKGSSEGEPNFGRKIFLLKSEKGVVGNDVWHDGWPLGSGGSDQLPHRHSIERTTKRLEPTILDVECSQNFGLASDGQREGEFRLFGVPFAPLHDGRANALDVDRSKCRLWIGARPKKTPVAHLFDVPNIVSDGEADVLLEFARPFATLNTGPQGIDLSIEEDGLLSNLACKRGSEHRTLNGLKH